MAVKNLDPIYGENEEQNKNLENIADIVRQIQVELNLIKERLNKLEAK